MPVANHEGSRITFPASFTTAGSVVLSGLNYNGTGHANEIREDIPDIAYQTVTVTSRTNNQPISAIGYRGVAAISDLIGSVDVSLEGILCWSDDVTHPYPMKALGAAASGLLNKDLNNFAGEWGMIVIDTKGEDSSDLGKLCCAYGLYVTSITYTFAANTSITTTWNFVGYNCTWEDSNLAFPTDMVTGTGVDFVPITARDVEVVATFPGGLTISNVQSATFTGTLNRDEVYALGSLAPIDRPVRYPFESSVSMEILADSASLLNAYTPDYVWNNPADPSSPNVITVTASYNNVNISGGTGTICSAPKQRPVDGALRVAVGANSSVTLNTTGWIIGL